MPLRALSRSVAAGAIVAVSSLLLAVGPASAIAVPQVWLDATLVGPLNFSKGESNLPIVDYFAVAPQGAAPQVPENPIGPASDIVLETLLPGESVRLCRATAVQPRRSTDPKVKSVKTRSGRYLAKSVKLPGRGFVALTSASNIKAGVKAGLLKLTPDPNPQGVACWTS